MANQPVGKPYPSPCCSIGIHYAEMMAYLLLNTTFRRPVQDSLPAHCYSFAPEWQTSSEEADRKAKATEQRYNATTNTHRNYLISALEIMSLYKTQNLSCGIFMGWSQQWRLIGPTSLRPKVDLSWLETVVFSASKSQDLLEHQGEMLECRSPWKLLPPLNREDQRETTTTKTLSRPHMVTKLLRPKS